MKKFNLLILVFACICSTLIWSGCESPNPNWKSDSNDPAFLHNTLQEITDVIVHDIFSPPVASRIYAYSNIAAYEALIPGYPKQQSFAGQLNGLEDVPQPEAGKEYCYPLAATKAMLVVGKQLIFSEDKIEAYESDLMKKMQAIKMPVDVFDRSIAYGESVGEHILQWADKDNYKQTRTFPKFTVDDNPARWKPTPPDYMDAIEPHWNDIRPFVLDSASQFQPHRPIPFDMTDKDSKFYKEVLEVYKIMDVAPDQKEERMAVAKFWDCNPYTSHHQGHVMFATKKITPGGHWMGITKNACKLANADIMTSAKAYALTSVCLADGFISSWDEKFRSDLVRPETVINSYLDPEWAPALQTPPFPEYTSAHSVISASASIALSSIFGNNFEYTDSVELEFGMPPRSFTSFRAAAEEAAVSRLYGGIHYGPSCFIGVDQGDDVGKFILAHVKLDK